MHVDQCSYLPEQFVEGLVDTNMQGKAQIITNPHMERPGVLVFNLDGAHSPESMDMCGRWFSGAIKEDIHHHIGSREQPETDSRKDSTQVLLFNCMPVRDPQLLLARLASSCVNHGFVGGWRDVTEEAVKHAKNVSESVEECCHRNKSLGFKCS